MIQKLGGFININKPPNMTSHDVVYKIRKLFKRSKVGHGGTLDPMATGVLPIAIGFSTRLIQYLDTGKIYKGTIRFGQTSTTDDVTGEITSSTEVPWLKKEQVLESLKKFNGTFMQKPPNICALKIGGKRLYEIANDKDNDNNIDWAALKTRDVTVHSIELIHFKDGPYPEAEVLVNCETGTYIRSIARECGETIFNLSTNNNSNNKDNSPIGAVLTKLERLKSGTFSLQNACTLEDLENSSLHEKSPENFLIHPFVALKHLPSITVKEEEKVTQWLRGRRLKFFKKDIEYSQSHQNCLVINDKNYSKTKFPPILKIHDHQNNLIGIINTTSINNDSMENNTFTHKSRIITPTYK